MISRFERFSSDIFRIYRCWHKIASDEMKKYGLKGPHAVYLVTMFRYADGITAAKLGELCSKDKSDVSRSITFMERKGLVTRECVNQNFYRALLKLTDNGKKAAERIGERARVAVEIAGKEISDKNRTIFYETLELISSNLQTISEEGLPK